ncbi:MAG TPA: type VI secretion system baseplate subunit TssE [Cellvibrio sp.]|nr:type VI secretion system baseplate subunit TssE [Cellvibrio sp.]
MRIGKKQELRPSILDRLMDDEPHIQIEQDKNRNQYLRDLRNSVKRDLENLLNTRFRMQSPPEEYREMEISILNYGLPDLATVNIADMEKKRAFTKNLEKTLRTFEPRFKSVKVVHIENKDTTDRTLRFRIDAMLHADPAPEVIIFDSVLDPVFRTVKVEESKHG